MSPHQDTGSLSMPCCELCPQIGAAVGSGSTLRRRRTTLLDCATNASVFEEQCVSVRILVAIALIIHRYFCPGRRNVSRAPRFSCIAKRGTDLASGRAGMHILRECIAPLHNG